MSQLREAFTALRADLIHKDGPRISTMRNYRFAIVPYAPTEEFELRGEVRRLSAELVANGWVVLTLSLQALMLERVRALGDAHLQSIIAMERRVSAYGLHRGVEHLRQQLSPLIEGPHGLAADCARIIRAHVEAHPEQAERTLVLIGRAGALYPFFRSSALLRHLDGHTGHVPVVLLYPGERRGPTGLSFMGIHEPDHDYRPRIYP